MTTTGPIQNTAAEQVQTPTATSGFVAPTFQGGLHGLQGISTLDWSVSHRQRISQALWDAVWQRQGVQQGVSDAYRWDYDKQALVRVGPDPNLRPAGEAMAEVIEDLKRELAGKPPAPPEPLQVTTPAPEKPQLSDDVKALHRALKFGQPQVMGGRGQWDNARYYEPE